jgi:hypothetical protein
VNGVAGRQVHRPDPAGKIRGVRIGGQLGKRPVLHHQGRVDVSQNVGDRGGIRAPPRELGLERGTLHHEAVDDLE